jgi:hypothetical protein
MVVITRSLILHTSESLEDQAESARLDRDYKGAASFRFTAVRLREWLPTILCPRSF